MINERDYPILKAFLEREAYMYQWKPETSFEHRSEFIDRMFKSILNPTRVTNDMGHSDEPCSEYNYIHIQSITNMGLLDSELVLSGDPWDSHTDLFCLLPPSPLGRVSFREECHGI